MERTYLDLAGGGGRCSYWGENPLPSLDSEAIASPPDLNYNLKKRVSSELGMIKYFLTLFPV